MGQSLYPGTTLTVPAASQACQLPHVTCFQTSASVIYSLVIISSMTQCDAKICIYIIHNGVGERLKVRTLFQIR